MYPTLETFPIQTTQSFVTEREGEKEGERERKREKERERKKREVGRERERERMKECVSICKCFEVQSNFTLIHHR